ncbi:hypothetical protein [Streptomyces puniciscabiei]|uniref:hypothetical protein n=1 Tax=Streptomyces puniciscabiei TaxID=164348 RepID=UPI00331FED71
MTASVASVLSGARILPVLTVASVATAGPLADALTAGGARCAEVTFRIPDAEQVGKATVAHGGPATEVMRALRAGLDTVKLFPAEPLGGMGMLKALAAPFPRARFLPTERGDYDGIRRLTAEAVERSRG